mgnify:CR=1 FL=1
MMDRWKPWRVCGPVRREALRQSNTTIRRSLRYEGRNRSQGKSAHCSCIKHLYGSWSPLKDSRLDEHEN